MHRAAACLFAGVACAAVALAQAPDPASPVDAVRAGRGRGAPRKGPPGPLPRLSDGHPDLTGIWNGFGGSGQPGPNMLPWAQKVVEERRARNGAEDYEARCLPGGPPRAAPYHTALFATPPGKKTWVVRIPRGSRYGATVQHLLKTYGFDHAGDTTHLRWFVRRNAPASIALRIRGAVGAHPPLN